MTTLYIIGNGFDLWHKLPTRYENFYDFAKEILDEISEYYSFDWPKGDNHPWHDFENALGKFDWHEFYEAHNNVDASAEDFRPSFVYGLEDELKEVGDNYVDKIKELFQEWVSGIDITVAEKKMSFVDSSMFINFNYTSTLQYIYNIPEERILHIHGRAESYDDLIFGHGETMQEAPELDESGDSNRTMFSDAQAAAKYLFYAMQKPVEMLLETHKIFFEYLSSIRKVIVIGHSLNCIDIPYFKEIAKFAPNANWTVCTYQPDHQSHFINALSTCGIPNDKIGFCKYIDLES